MSDMMTGAAPMFHSALVYLCIFSTFLLRHCRDMKIDKKLNQKTLKIEKKIAEKWSILYYVNINCIVI